MTRRLVLAWSFGASLGLAVGFLLGESVRDGLDLARLGRSGPRTRAGTGTSATEALNAALRGAERFPFPAQRLPLDDDTEAQAWLDAGRCAAVSPGGGLRCIINGPHTGHWWEAVYAPDRKDDADERIE